VQSVDAVKLTVTMTISDNLDLVSVSRGDMITFISLQKSILEEASVRLCRARSFVPVYANIE
jgi:hypothetical protein